MKEAAKNAVIMPQEWHMDRVVVSMMHLELVWGQLMARQEDKAWVASDRALFCDMESLLCDAHAKVRDMNQAVIQREMKEHADELYKE